MDSWKKVDLTKEEEAEGVEAEEEEICGEEIFAKSLVGKLWTDNPFNARIFKQVVTQAWRLKNTVEVQDLSKNLFLFRFATKRDVDSVLRNGPWSFDRNTVVLKRLSGDEQPSDMEMHTGEFWARIYDLPLKLRSESMARKLGDVLGSFLEMDSKEGNRMGKFLRVKVNVDLRKPLKRGTIVKYQGKNLRVYFKYERLPTFCFVCGRIGHQIKDCEEMEGKEDSEFEEIEEKELLFGQWMRASPLPKTITEVKKETSSESCGKMLFSETSNSGGGPKEGNGKEIVVEQIANNITQQNPNFNKEVEKSQSEVESVAESLGNVVITPQGLNQNDKGSNTKSKTTIKPTKKWVRKKGAKKGKTKENQLVAELGKRQLVEVTISEGDPMDLCRVEQKRRITDEKVCSQLPEGVLDDQHLLPQ
jgi:hypothetical protein